MATDAVILVESLKNGRKTPEYLIFVKGDKFKDSWSLVKALEEFCGKNAQGFEMSYNAGVSPKEFETRFTDELSKVNILFARTPEDLDALKKRFGVLDVRNLSEELFKNDHVNKKEIPLAHPADDCEDIFFDKRNDLRRGENLTNAWLNFFIIIAAVTGIVYLFIFCPINRVLKILIRLFKKAKNRQGA